ncbi:hypothetical protein L210DRAFT_821242, partial [Boletus edulis BED1]
ELQATVKLALGMRVLVTRNIDTQEDITNGARGTVVDIVLNADEPFHNDTYSSITHLQHPPSFILVELDYKR